MHAISHCPPRPPARARARAQVLALAKRHFDVLLDPRLERTLHLIKHKYEARYPPADVLVRRHHAAGRWEEYKTFILQETRRTLPSEGGKGPGASAIFGMPPWARKRRGLGVDEHGKVG